MPEGHVRGGVDKPISSGLEAARLVGGVRTTAGVLPEPDASRLSRAEPGPGRLYGLWILICGLGLIGAAVVTFGLALRYTLVPLEGVPLDDAGEVLPLPPVRVALLALDEGTVQTSPQATGRSSSLHRDPGREAALWLRSLRLAGAAPETVGDAWIPTGLGQAQVLILPWDAQVSPQAAERIERFLQAGGALIGQGHLTPEALLARWFQVTPLPADAVDAVSSNAVGSPLQERSPRLELLFTGSSPRLARVPASRRAVVNRVVLPAVRFQAAQPLAALQEEGRSLSPVQVGPPAPPERVILAEGAYHGARTAWVGIQPDWLYGSPGRTHALQEVVDTLLPWLADRPDVEVSQRPGPLVPDVALVVPPVSAECQEHLAGLLKAQGLTATWLIRATAEASSEVSLPAGALAHSGLEVPVGLSGLGFGRLTQWLQQQEKALETAGLEESLTPAAEMKARRAGLRLSLEDDTPWMRDALREAGVPYLLRREALVRGWVLPEEVRQVGRASFWRVPPAWPWKEGLRPASVAMLPEWLEALRPPVPDGLRVLELGCIEGQGSELPGALLEALGDRSHWHAGSVEQHLAERTATREVVATLNPLREGRYHLRVKGGVARLENLSLRLHFPGEGRLVSADSHQVGAPELLIQSSGAGEAQVALVRLDPSRTWDWFLGVETGGK